MIIISPFAKKMRNGKPHPKDYPYWPELLEKIDEPVCQIGVSGETQLVNLDNNPYCPDTFLTDLSFADLEKLVNGCRTWISVDSFFQHFCWDLGKPGIVLFGQSDPNIFGHSENTNLLKDRKYLREKQFWLWEQAEFNADAFVSPDVILNALEKFK